MRHIFKIVMATLLLHQFNVTVANARTLQDIHVLEELLINVSLLVVLAMLLQILARGVGRLGPHVMEVRLQLLRQVLPLGRQVALGQVLATAVLIPVHVLVKVVHGRPRVAQIILSARPKVDIVVERQTVVAVHPLRLLLPERCRVDNHVLPILNAETLRLQDLERCVEEEFVKMLFAPQGKQFLVPTARAVQVHGFVVKHVAQPGFAPQVKVFVPI